MRRKLILSLWALVALTSFFSCNKDDDDDTTTAPSLEGTLSFNLPYYVEVGETYTLEPSEITRPSDDDCDSTLGVAWKVSPMMSSYDTVRYEGWNSDLYDGKYTYEIPDTLCTITVYCMVFASGYSNTTASSQSIIVSPDSSLTGFTYSPECFDFTDSRDGNVYKARKIGSLDWMCENLRYKDAGQSFYKSSVMDTLYGRMYSQTEAASSCPPGWRLPSNEDWMELANVSGSYKNTDPFTIFPDVVGEFLTLGSFNGEKIWEYTPKVNVTNSTSMNMIPTGFARLVDGEETYAYAGDGYYGLFWTSDLLNSDQAYYRYIFRENPDFGIGKADKSEFLVSVRCVR